MAVSELVLWSFFASESDNIYEQYAYELLDCYNKERGPLPVPPSVNIDDWRIFSATGAYNKLLALSTPHVDNEEPNPIAAYLVGLEYDVTGDSEKKEKAIEKLELAANKLFLPALEKLKTILSRPQEVAVRINKDRVNAKLSLLHKKKEISSIIDDYLLSTKLKDTSE